MERVVIVEALRTPNGRFLGGLSTVPAPKLGAALIKEILSRTKLDPGAVDEVIMGNVLQAAVGQNPARQAAIYGGVSSASSAMTVNKVCGSGMKSVMLASQAIKLGDADIILAGGMENMSLAPYYLKKARTGQRLGNGELVDGMIHDGLWDCYNDYHMGTTGELVAEKYNVSREAQDEYAVESHRKAARAIEEGDFEDEILPISIPQRKGDPVVISTDEGPRKDADAAKLGKLRPAFKKDGTVTPGNASTINDGAAVLLLMSESKAKELGLGILATVVETAAPGVAVASSMTIRASPMSRSLRFGFLSRQRASSRRTDSGVSCGSTVPSGSTFNTAASVSVTVSPAKAFVPESISYSTQPKAQMSARLSTG